MRIIFLISFLYTLVLANQTQIVLGTFSTKANASKIKSNVNKIIKKDKKFHNFIDKNSLEVTSKKHGKYFIVTIEPFNDKVTLYSVLKRLKKTRYKDAYALALSKTTTKKIKKIIKKEEPKKIKATDDVNIQIVDDPYLMDEPDINSLKIEITSQKNDISALKKEKKDIVIEEKVTPKKTKELDVLETYFNEIIAAVAILILIVIYFIMKRSQQKKKDNFEDSTPTMDVQERHEEVTQEVAVIQDSYDTQEQTQEPEPMVMEEKVEAINFNALSGEEEGSFGVEENLKPIETNLTRVKRDIPPHGKITKDNFKEFAGLKILVAEDNIINQKVITGLLADSGIEVTIADDGQFLLEILEGNSDYNFILMDAHMPRVDGFEATKKIRQNPELNHIIIIALSGDTAVDDIKKMSEAGMEEYLEKPLKIESFYDILFAYSQNENSNKLSDEFVEVMITDELDTDQGLSICGDDEEFYNEILDEFVKTYTNSTDSLQELLNKNEMNKADRYLLDLSGITANIGANHISQIALNLKEAISDPQDKKYIELLKDYAKSLHNLLEDIEKYKA